MKNLIKFEFEDGKEMWVEVDEPDKRGLRNSSTLTQQGARAAQSFDNAFAAIRPSIEKIRDMLNDLNNPEQVEVEFGIKLSGEVGAFLASASTEANFSVKLTWNNPKRNEG